MTDTRRYPNERNDPYIAIMCANGETVDAHKVVLALHSTLLWEMFSSGGEEEERLVILLPQFPANLVRSCMALLYKGKVVLRNGHEMLKEHCRKVHSITDH